MTRVSVKENPVMLNTQNKGLILWGMLLLFFCGLCLVIFMHASYNYRVTPEILSKSQLWSCYYINKNVRELSPCNITPVCT